MSTVNINQLFIEATIFLRGYEILPMLNMQRMKSLLGKKCSDEIDFQTFGRSPFKQYMNFSLCHRPFPTVLRLKASKKLLLNFLLCPKEPEVDKKIITWKSVKKDLFFAIAQSISNLTQICLHG